MPPCAWALVTGAGAILVLVGIRILYGLSTWIRGWFKKPQWTESVKPDKPVSGIDPRSIPKEGFSGVDTRGSNRGGYTSPNRINGSNR